MIIRSIIKSLFIYVNKTILTIYINLNQVLSKKITKTIIFLIQNYNFFSLRTYLKHGISAYLSAFISKISTQLKIIYILL